MVFCYNMRIEDEHTKQNMLTGTSKRKQQKNYMYERDNTNAETIPIRFEMRVWYNECKYHVIQ